MFGVRGASVGAKYGLWSVALFLWVIVWGLFGVIFGFCVYSLCVGTGAVGGAVKVGEGFVVVVVDVLLSTYAGGRGTSRRTLLLRLIRTRTIVCRRPSDTLNMLRKVGIPTMSSGLRGTA